MESDVALGARKSEKSGRAQAHAETETVSHSRRTRFVVDLPDMESDAAFQATASEKPRSSQATEKERSSSPGRFARSRSTRSGRSVAPDHWNIPLPSVSMVTAESFLPESCVRQSMDIHFQIHSETPEPPSLLARAGALLQDVSCLRLIAAVSWICTSILICILCVVTQTSNANCDTFFSKNGSNIARTTLVTTVIATRTTLAPKKFNLPEKRLSSFFVNISVDSAWSRSVSAKLLSAKGMSAVLYSYREADVGDGVARVLKIPRSSELAEDMELEARMTATLPRIGMFGPRCVVCQVQFDDAANGHRCSTQALVKEFLYGYDLDDVIIAMGRADLDDPDLAAILKMVGRPETRWYKKDARRDELRDSIQEALLCVVGRLATHVLSGSPHGIFLDLSDRNFMWATLKHGIGSSNTYKLWLVDAMMFPPESTEYRFIIKSAPAEIWYRYYVVPWSTAGPGKHAHDHWPRIEMPQNPIKARPWVSHCTSQR